MMYVLYNILILVLLTYGSNGTTTTTPDLTESSPNVKINRDPECDMTKGCFPAASECSTDCDYLVTWQPSGVGDVEFTMQRKTTSEDSWIGIGFSDDTRMGNDSVVECVSIKGNVDVKISYNTLAPNYHNERPANNEQYGVNLKTGSYANGILSCTFTRNIKGLVTSGQTETTNVFFDLNTKWHLFVAYGLATQGKKSKHQESPAFSTQKIDFLTIGTGITTTTSSDNTGIIRRDSKCGESIGCYHDCNHDDTCGFLLTWMDLGNSVAFTLTCNRPDTNVYCAIGMSKDKRMGDDSVFECVSSGQVSVYTSYNDGRVNYRLTRDKFGLSNVTATHVDGILKCSFVRDKTAVQAEQSKNRVKRAREPSAATFFDADDDFNLLYAYGSSVGGYINQHQVEPKVSAMKADFQSFIEIGAKSTVHILEKVHGVLMLFAWMFLARLGIFLAGRYKTTWPEGKEWCGLKRWFILHRFFMTMTLMVTLTGALMIFVHVGGYSKISGEQFEQTHPIIGIITISLVTINPVMALFRPKPDAARRRLFNFAHLTVGISANVCAVVNIFSGFSLANAPEDAKLMVYIYIGWVGLIEIIAFIYDVKNNRGHDEGTSPILGYNTSKEEAYEMKSTAGYESEILEQRVSKFKIILLFLHGIGAFTLSIAASVLVWKVTEDDH